jgi:nitrate/TMAO reductase-like tetraheme cytochrome c subunit
MSLLTGITLLVALIAMSILVVYWVKQPSLDVKWRLLLFLGVAMLPTIGAATSTVESMNQTSTREFCGSCHVMTAHFEDAVDPTSMSLAARHTRNDLFGEHSCYNCHAEYGMLGYPLTKMSGLGHVWHYYFGGYNRMSLEEALSILHTAKPYPNQNCMHCHSGSGRIWKSIPDHMAAEEQLRENQVSCASVGCHGAPHPATLRAREAAHTSAWLDFSEVPFREEAP